MAISGVVDADVETMAKDLGVSRKRIAFLLGYTYKAKTLALTDSGSHVGSLAWTNFQGILNIDWGDGSAIQRVSASAGSPQTHTFAAAGSKTVTVAGSGESKAVTASIA